MIKKDVHSEPVNIQSSIEVIATKIYKPESITVCNIYISPNRNFTYNDLLAIVDQLPRPIILVGDMNGHKLWGSRLFDNKNRGSEIDKFIGNNEILILINDGSPIHFSSSGTLSAIDLFHVDVELVHKILGA